MSAPHGLRIGIFIAVLFLALSGGMAAAQTSTAGLRGTVVDASGAVLPDVVVTLTNVDTNVQRQTRTADRGTFSFVAVPPGRYVVTAERQGFAQSEVPDLVLHVNDQIAIRLEMRVRSLAESVTVRAEAVRVKTAPAVSNVVDRQFVENLPLNGRSINALIELTPGVALVAEGAGQFNGQFSVNGQRPNSNYFSVDGVGANVGINPTNTLPGTSSGGSLPAYSSLGTTQNLVSVDALEEFRIQTSSFAPEFGRSPGAQVSMVTRSGTNALHGTVFDYLRNDQFDANDWFANSRSLAKAPLRQNNFGGVLGGPVRRNETFFFFSYEGLRLRQPQTRIGSVPSLASRAAATGDLKRYFEGYPLPTGPDQAGGMAEIAYGFSDPSELNAASIRIDHRFGPRVNVFGRYNRAPSNTAARTLNGIGTTELTTDTLTLAGTVTLGSHATNDLRVNWAGNVGRRFQELDNFGGSNPPPDSFMFLPWMTFDDAIAIFSVGGSSLQLGKGARNEQHQFNLVENFTYVRGSHQFKFGLDYRHLTPYFSGRSIYGLTFTNATDALAGNLSILQVNAAEPPRIGTIDNYSMYGQDTWQASSRLTLTYGVRWEYNPAPGEKNGNLPVTVLNFNDFATMQIAPRGTPLFDASWKNFGPRGGAAYQLSQHPGRETILRGGVGVFHDLGIATIGNAYGNVFPFTISRVLQRIAYPPSPSDLQPPTGFDFRGGQVWIYDPNLQLPYTVQWNTAIEQALGPAQSISITYVGAAGHKLLKRDGFSGPNVGRPDFGSVNITRNTASSDYKSLQIQYQRRLTNGFQATGAYTFAHATDNASSDVTSPTQALVEFYDPERDRGDADFDVRHTFSGAVSYNLPSPSTGWGHAVFGDWWIDGLVRARSALPLTVTATGNLGFGTLNVRPNVVPDTPIWIDDPVAPGGRRLNRNAFVVPTSGQGDLKRNSIRGFGASQVDLAIRREFHLPQSIRVQMRAEFFNLFNHPNFADPVVALANALFGSSTQMLGRSLGGVNALYQIGGPRSAQFALKVLF